MLLFHKLVFAEAASRLEGTKHYGAKIRGGVLWCARLSGWSSVSVKLFAEKQMELCSAPSTDVYVLGQSFFSHLLRTRIALTNSLSL